MPDTERAENTGEASPASPQSASSAPTNKLLAEAQAPIPASFFTGEADPSTAEKLGAQELAIPDADAARAEPLTAENEGDGQPAGMDAETPAQKAEREKFIPRERFDQVNERAQKLEAEAAQARQQAADFQEAMAIGLNSVDQLHGLRQEARQFGFQDTATYLQAVQQQRQAEAAIQATQERFDLSDETKAELIQAQQLNLQTQQQLLQARQSVAFAQQQQQAQSQRDQDAAIEKAKTSLGGLDPELETIFRQSSPQVIAQATAALEKMLKDRAGNSVAQYAAAKAEDRRVPAPEGRGGNPPPAAQAGKGDFRNSSWGTLLTGGRKG